MSRSSSTFRERDIRAAIRAVEKAGKFVGSIEIAPDGTIRILTQPLLHAAENDGLAGWEDV